MSITNISNMNIIVLNVMVTATATLFMTVSIVHKIIVQLNVLFVVSI